MPNWTKIGTLVAVAAVTSAVATTAVASEAIKGRVDVVNTARQTITVAGITFQVNAGTQFEAGVKSFADIQQGQKVKVNFKRQGNQYLAQGIALQN